MFHDLLSDKSTTDLSSGASALLRFVVRDAVQQAVQQIHDKSYSWLYDLSLSMSATSRREWNLSFALCTAVHRVIVIGTPKHHQLYADTASRLIRPFSSVIMHPTAHTITAYSRSPQPRCRTYGIKYFHFYRSIVFSIFSTIRIAYQTEQTGLHKF